MLLQHPDSTSVHNSQMPVYQARRNTISDKHPTGISTRHSEIGQALPLSIHRLIKMGCTTSKVNHAIEGVNCWRNLMGSAHGLGVHLALVHPACLCVCSDYTKKCKTITLDSLLHPTKQVEHRHTFPLMRVFHNKCVPCHNPFYGHCCEHPLDISSWAV